MDLDRSPDQLIKAGLAALKQKDYGRAIAIFQDLSQAEGISTSHRLKAQMGLIRTYEAQGANAQAQALCQPLLKSRSRAIRQWGHDKLQQLIADAEQLFPQPASRDSAPVSGFVPDAPSGFVPFSADESTSEPAVSPDRSGMATDQTTPIKPTQTTPIDAVSNATSIRPQHPPDTTATHLSTLLHPSTQDLSPQDPKADPASLFHYQTLNRNQRLRSEDLQGADPAEHNNFLATPSQTQRPSPPPTPPAQTAPNESQDAPPPGLIPVSPFTAGAKTAGPQTWPQGERLRTVKSLGKVSVGRLWFAQWTTIPIIFLIVRWLVKTSLTLLGDYLEFLEQLLPFINIRISNFFWEPQYWSVLIGLGVLTIAVPWLWPWLLQPADQITRSQLQTYSPEAEQLVRRLCAKRRWPVPKIQRLASDLPLIFSYGWRPRYGQLVVSQGLLDRLEPDELAVLIMYEMSHWSSLDWVFFSTHGLLLQGCHRAYWFLARWGDERPMMIRMGAGTLATLSYGIFWLLAKVGCGLARTRIPYRDRIATELTGNPNGLVRALAKLSAAMADAVEQQGYTPPLVESLELMLPVGPHPAGASAQHYAWGALNPLRHWLSINQAQPPLGDRLYTLGAYGRHWRLKPSLNVANLRLKNSVRTLSAKGWRDLLLQGGAWSGLVIGLGIAMGLWLIGAISTSLDFPLLDWLYKDRSILMGIPLIGFATGQLLRMNAFFPDITDIPTTSDAQLSAWQTDHTLIPLRNHPIKVSGTLTGRPALANWLGQEWRLHTRQGSIQLHHVSYYGPLGNIKGFAAWLREPLQVTGWLRRGHHVWIDLEHLQTHQNHTKISQHPTWAVITSFIPLIYGLWLIFRGS